MISGGKKISEKEALKIAFKAIESGAAGVDMGRNIFQSDRPLGMIQAVKAIVHEGDSVAEAIKISTNQYESRSLL